MVRLILRLFSFVLDIFSFCKDHPDLLGLPDTPRKILDVAKQSDDQMIFYSVFRFFEQAVPVLQGGFIQNLIFN